MKLGYSLYCLDDKNNIHRLSTDEFVRLFEGGVSKYAGKVLKCGNIYVAARNGVPYIYRENYFKLKISTVGICVEEDKTGDAIENGPYVEWKPTKHEHHRIINEALSYAKSTPALPATESKQGSQ